MSLASAANMTTLTTQDKICDKAEQPDKSGKADLAWLEVGCGDGYYTKRLLDSASRQPPHLANLIALDISKPAVMSTAKVLRSYLRNSHGTPVTDNHTRYMPCQVYCIVASASHMPIIDASVDVLTSIFSPILPSEFARVVKQGGKVIIAKPDSNHLLGLRQGLFDTVIAHDSAKFIDTLSPYFDLVDEMLVKDSITIGEDDLQDLLTMTPYAYKASRSKQMAFINQCQQSPDKTITLDTAFVLYSFVRK